MKPICVTCGLFYRMKEAGIRFEEGMPGPNGARRPTLDEVGQGQQAWTALLTGLADIAGAELSTRVIPGPLPNWQGYKLWIGDLWECRGCGHLLISGVALAPLAEHYQEGYAEKVVTERSLLRVDDC